ncbi:MAG: DMT family transporter [Phycisphaerae bacterium]|jgi:drug/metabolite transporter (DMT)-like permease|nr:DMT family transporter [Phycisphaerae bacterium]
MKPAVEIPLPQDESCTRYPVWVYHSQIIVSAFCFALSTLLAKFAQNDGASSSMITFMRFAIGLGGLLGYMGIRQTKIEPRNPIVLILRGVFNLIAVFLFYYAIEFTTITNANLLNMTYPVFVAMLSPIFLREHVSLREWKVLAIACAGIFLIINPSFGHTNIGDLIGLGAGFTGALAIIMLCFARQSNHTVTVLLFLFGLGTLLTWPAVLNEHYEKYTPATWIFLLTCGITGAIGQFAITTGFKYLSAVAGSITGMSRVVIAAILGLIFLAEIPTWNVVIGSGILFGAIFWLTMFSQKNKPT